MTDVEAGGATVFPLVGAKVFPEKVRYISVINLTCYFEIFFHI